MEGNKGSIIYTKNVVYCAILFFLPFIHQELYTDAEEINDLCYKLIPSLKLNSHVKKRDSVNNWKHKYMNVLLCRQKSVFKWFKPSCDILSYRSWIGTAKLAFVLFIQKRQSRTKLVLRCSPGHARWSFFVRVRVVYLQLVRFKKHFCLSIGK